MRARFSRLYRLTLGDGLPAYLLRGTLGSGVLRFANMLLTVGVAVLLARALGPEGYGMYAFAFSIITLLSIPARLGLPTLVIREMPRCRMNEDWGLMRGLLRRANQAVLGLSVLLMLVAAACAWVLVGRADPTQLSTFIYALPLLPLISLGDLRGAALRGLLNVVQGLLPEMLLTPGLLLVFAGLIILMGHLTPEKAMAVHGVAATIAFLIGALLLLRKLPSPVWASAPRYETAAWTRSVLPLSFIAGVQVINSQTDIIMLGILTSGEDVGIYRVAVQGATLVTFGFTVLNMVIGPQISRLYCAGDMIRLQRMVTLSARLGLFTALPIAVVLVVFGKPILGVVFGDDYVGAHMALAILCIGQVVSAGMGSVASLLVLTGNESETTKGFLAAAITNVIMNLVLVPFFGIEGAALSSAISIAALNILLARKVYAQLSINSAAIHVPYKRCAT